MVAADRGSGRRERWSAADVDRTFIARLCGVDPSRSTLDSYRPGARKRYPVETTNQEDKRCEPGLPNFR